MNKTKSRFIYLSISIFTISALLIVAGCSKKTTSTTSAGTTTITTTATTSTQSLQYSINSTSKTGIGTYLVDGKGLTLYWTSRDSIGQSNITGATLANWPVFYVSNISVPSLLNSSDFGSITRTDGSKQTTFKGWPLYYYFNDQLAGDTLGQGLAGVWFAVNPATSAPPAPISTTALSTVTTLTSFPYQGSGTGNWSGQITYNNKTYSISGTMSVTVDSNGVFSGSISSDKTGGTADTVISAQVDPNGNLTGTVSFTVSGTIFITNWQGKITASGNSLNMQGTWTSQYGSGTFSGTGTSSK